jgi:hypothetical protein
MVVASEQPVLPCGGSTLPSVSPNGRVSPGGQVGGSSEGSQPKSYPARPVSTQKERRPLTVPWSKSACLCVYVEATALAALQHDASEELTCLFYYIFDLLR